MDENDIEVYQVLSSGEVISFGSHAHAEQAAVAWIDGYPKAGFHYFLARRVLEPVDV